MGNEGFPIREGRFGSCEDTWMVRVGINSLHNEQVFFHIGKV